MRSLFAGLAEDSESESEEGVAATPTQSYTASDLD